MPYLPFPVFLNKIRTYLPPYPHGLRLILVVMSLAYAHERNPYALRGLSIACYFLDKAGRAIIRKAILKSKMKTRRNMALTAAKPRRWLMKAVL